jgi:hypothetical protein
MSRGWQIVIARVDQDIIDANLWQEQKGNRSSGPGLLEGRISSHMLR